VHGIQAENHWPGERVANEKLSFKFAMHTTAQLKPKKPKSLLRTLSTQFIIAQATQAQLAFRQSLQDGHAEEDLLGCPA